MGYLEDLSKRVEGVANMVKLKDHEADYYVRFMDLLDHIEKGVGRVVIMVYEFPQTRHNINKAHGADEARKLLQLSRALRHHKLAEDSLSFIFTGSISLFPMVEKIGSLADVNDLEPIEVKPLTRDEARELLIRLCNNGNISVTPEATEYLLDTIRCFIPFHIQLIYQELEDIFENIALVDADIETAINNTINAKNKARFEPYFSRLKGLLERHEYAYAMEILTYTAKNDSVDEAIIYDLAVKHALDNQKEMIEMLCEDGYLFKSEQVFIYTSPILQLWCKKFN
jgi:hypothetical protein